MTHLVQSGQEATVLLEDRDAYRRAEFKRLRPMDTIRIIGELCAMGEAITEELWGIDRSLVSVRQLPDALTRDTLFGRRMFRSPGRSSRPRQPYHATAPCSTRSEAVPLGRQRAEQMHPTGSISIGVAVEGADQIREVARDTSDPRHVMQRIVEQAVELVAGAEGAAIELLVAGKLRYVCTTGSLADFVGTSLDPSNSLSGLAVLTGVTQRCDDSECDSRVDREACRRVGSTSMICVPLRRGNEPVGVLKVSSSKRMAFETFDVATLSRLARFVTTSITTARELSEAAEDLFRRPRDGASARVDESAMSTFVANVIHPGASEGIERRERVRTVLERHCLAAMLQPVVDLRTRTLVGAEALARISLEPVRTPDIWFAEARRAQLGVELQLEAARRAVEAAAVLPAGAFLAINFDDEALSCDELPRLLAELSPRPVVLELTEHVGISDYRELRRVLNPLRRAGALVAIDDTGAGYSSFAHIVKLAPELIKLDIELVRGIDVDPVRRSLVTAVVSFARETGSKVVAEGIETEVELEVLADLSVDYGQGYVLARPMPPELFASWMSTRMDQPVGQGRVS